MYHSILGQRVTKKKTTKKKKKFALFRSSQISSRRMFTLDTREFLKCMKFTSHYLKDATVLSNCVVDSVVFGKFPSFVFKHLAG